MSQVDLSSLSVQREAPRPVVLGKPHWWSRYFIPALLIAGFVVLLAWAGRDLVFPPRSVTTTPVITSRGESTEAGGELFRAAGWIEPRPTPIRVPALAPGIIRKLNVVEDQEVAADEPIAELVDEDAKLAVQESAADLELRKAELEIAQAVSAAALTRFQQPVHLQAALSEAEANLAECTTEIQSLPFEQRQAEAERDFAKLDYERKQQADESISRRALDEAKSVLDSAVALVEQWVQKNNSLKEQHIALSNRRDAIRNQLKLLADELQAKDESIAGVKVAEARVEQARVALANAQLQLDRMIIRAPVAGRIFRLVSFPGAGVGPSGVSSEEFDPSTVVTLYQPESLQIRADVRFENLPLIRLDQRATIMNPALKEPLPGKVLYISSQADIQKNTLQVKVSIETPAALLKPEMLVEVIFFGDETAAAQSTGSVLRVFALRTLILSDEQGDYVWNANQSRGVAEKKRVTTGIQLGDLVEISSGLNASSRLIDSDLASLQENQRIRIVEHPMLGAGPQSPPSSK